MKLSLFTATLALSVASVSGSAPAFADTLFGVPAEDGYFTFSDDRLNPDSASPQPSFATLGVGHPLPEHPGLNVHFLSAYMDPNNPYSSNPGAAIAHQAYYYTIYPSGDPWFEREQYAIDSSFFWIYISGSDGSAWYNYENVAEGSYSYDPFDRDELRAVTYSTLPLSTFGIFDFENSFVYYAGETEGVSLAQVFAQFFAPGQPVSPGVSVEVFPGENNFWISWADDRDIVAISLTYNLNAIPEPETWAMLLAGLGIVGAVTRRRRTRAAM
ncbi:MAG: PEPxxWA-CTERM sorting domain-containing protein [Betaproteobacteria bacterium]|nr:PEPxxWA-CTERM sorting domain-containing protein [Betaproteobacteria bacterium]